MTRDELTGDISANPALRRVLERVGGSELLDLLAEGLPGADLTTLLLEVFRRRAERISPPEVMRRYRGDRFVSPAPVSFAALRRAEDALFSALPDGFEVLVLAPVLPLAAHSAVATVDPRKVVATVRGSEVAADPTNALALEASLRRSAALAADPRSSALIRLAASQRVVRAQQFDDPGMLAHFQLFGLVTAGRDTGGRSFEQQQLTEHLQFAARALAAAGARRTWIRLTCLAEAASPVIDQVCRDLTALSDVEVSEDPDRTSGRGYYTGLCFKVYADIAGRELEIGDGGFVDWSQLFTGNRKERLLISGFGVDRLAETGLGVGGTAGVVTAVGSNGEYSFTKPNRASIRLLAGLGVEGDVHAGVTVKHRSRVAQDPTQPNLRQVHLIQAELFAELAGDGFDVAPGDLGENITTSGIDLLGLPVGTLLRIGGEAVVEVTGLRNPCLQIDNFQDGLLKQVVGRDEAGNLVRKSGIMSVVRVGGVVRPGDTITAELPEGPHRPLDRV